MGFRGCRHPWETSTSVVEPICLFFCGPLCRWKRSCSSRPNSTVPSPRMGHHLRCTTFKCLCRSAVRSRLKRDSKLGRALAVCLTSPSGATLLQAQRVVLSFVCLSVPRKEFLSSRVHPSCGKRPYINLFLQSQRNCEVHPDLCQLGQNATTHSYLVGKRGSL